MLIMIGETYLEVTPSGKRRVGGDIIPFLQASYLTTPGLYTGTIGDDENGEFLEKESMKMLEGGFVYLPHPEAKTLICNLSDKGKRSFINVDSPFYIPAQYLFRGLFSEFADQKFLIALSSSLLRKEEAYQTYLEVLKFRKEKNRPMFIMDLAWEKELFLHKEEEVKERMRKILPNLDIILTDCLTLRKLYEGKEPDELVKQIPQYEKKFIIFFDKDKVYFKGEEVYRLNGKNPYKKRRPFYYGALLTLMDQEGQPKEGDDFAQDHFLALLASELSSEKKEDIPFVSSNELLDVIKKLRSMSELEPIHEA